jgi:GMP synthase-like glutamine amidotransferase
VLSIAEHNSFDNDPWILKLVEFTEKLLKQNRVRTIGVCFGHQIIGRALGVKVGRSDNGWEISVLPVELTAKGKEIFQQDTLVCHGLRVYCLVLTNLGNPPNAQRHCLRVS